MQAYTITGKKCANWTRGAYYLPPNVMARKHTKAGLGDHNFCRNPDSHTTIWCYTEEDNTKWEECKTVKCK